MKEYDKEKLHEYAKELFALCLDKKLDFEFDNGCAVISVYDTRLGLENLIKVGHSYLCKERFSRSTIASKNIPIWELIEKVKVL